MKRQLLAVSLLLPAALVWAAREAAPTFNAERYLAHIKFLASPELKGRGTGSPELEKAAEYIVSQFRSFGLKPVKGNGYEQGFQVTTNAHLGPHNRFNEVLPSGARTLDAGTGFVPFNFSSTGEAEGPVVFAGYGITAKEYHYDDYAGIDAKGKFVLIVRHEPQENDEKSPFAGKNLTMHAQFAIKAANAKVHGARGVILVNDTPHPSGESDKFEIREHHRHG